MFAPHACEAGHVLSDGVQAQPASAPDAVQAAAPVVRLYEPAHACALQDGSVDGQAGGNGLALADEVVVNDKVEDMTDIAEEVEDATDVMEEVVLVHPLEGLRFWYTSTTDSPPQVSVTLPPQGIEHCVSFVAVPTTELPQRHVMPLSTPKKSEPQQNLAQASRVMFGLDCEGPARAGCWAEAA